MTAVTEQVPLALRTRGLEMPWNRVLAAAAGPAGAARALGPWHPQEFQAECVETYPESGDMMTLRFRRLDGAPLAFRSGQYINIDFPVDGPAAEPISRSYSISSPPTEPWTFSITVKRDPNGVVSRWIHSTMAPGAVLDMLGPVGAFHLPDHDRRARFLFLAAGSGITPLMSMIRTIHSLPGQADAVLLYHGSAPGRFAFAEELDWLTRADFRITVVYSLGDREWPGSWTGQVGRISPDLIDAVAPDANGRQVFACGPQGYLDAATEALTLCGVDDTSVNVEFFTGDRAVRLEYAEEVAIAGGLAEDFAAAVEEDATAALPPVELGMYAEYESEPETSAIEIVDAEAPPPLEGEPAASVESSPDGLVLVSPDPVAEVPVASAAAAPSSPVPSAPAQDSFTTVGDGRFTMSFMRSQVNVRIDPDEKVLSTARAAGVRISSNCQEGMCGSCKLVKLEGDVEMNHQGGIRAREISAGKFLACCSTPLTDLVIDA